MAAGLVPRPGYPIYGLAAPTLRPVTVTESQRQYGAWEVIVLSYGDTKAGPYVQVIMAGPDAQPSIATTVEADGTERTEPWEPPALAESTRERLPAGEALVTRHGDQWRARLLDRPETVTVTLIGRGAAPDDVRLESLPDLEAIFAAQHEEMIARIERARRNRVRRPPEPEPDLEPAEGIAALRALTDFTLRSEAEHRAAVRDRSIPPHSPAWGQMHGARIYGALWRRAAREYQRLSGADPRTADDVITTAVNHLGHLAEHAPWFTADERLREAATDETLRHAMLGDPVPSEPAQRAWSRYWSGRLGAGDDGFSAEEALARHERARPLQADWLAAWESWAGQARGPGGQ
jgi:hypothetical protein